MKFGIDVSRWQGNFNFAKAKTEGVEFAIIKAGGGDSGLYKDSKYERNYSECIKNGISVGAYFFGQAMNTDTAIKEADYFCKLLEGKTFPYLVWYDVEAKMLKAKNLDAIVIAFINRVIANGYKCGIYASESTLKSLCKNVTINAYPHWTARWSKTKPSVKSDIWQFGGETNYIRTNKVAGVTCDQNYLLNDSIISGDVTPTNYDEENKIILGKYYYTSPIDKKKIDMGYVFNPIWYANHWIDLKNTFGYDDKKLFEHFLTFGMFEGKEKEGRQASANFNPVAYRKNYPALVKEYGTKVEDNPKYYEHYCRFGYKEGRKAV